MKSILFRSFLIVFFIPFCVSAQIKLEKKKFLNNKIELLVPADFKPMSAYMLNLKYPNRSQQPNVTLTDDAGEVNIIISTANQPIQPGQIMAFKNFQMATLKRAHPDTKWLEDGVKPVNGKKIGYFKFISKAVDQAVFNYYVFTDLNGKMLLFSFNCTEVLYPKWKETIETIVSSMKVVSH